MNIIIDRIQKNIFEVNLNNFFAHGDGQVLLQAGYSLNVKPGTAAWFCFQAEDNILLLGVVRRPEIEA